MDQQLYQYLLQGSQPLTPMSTESMLPPSQVVAPMASIQNVPSYQVPSNITSAPILTTIVPTNPMPHQQTISTHHIRQQQIQMVLNLLSQPQVASYQRQHLQQTFQPVQPIPQPTQDSLTVTTLQPVPQGLQNSKQELEQYQLQRNAPHISLTKPNSTVTTLQQVPQVLQNAKQDLQQAPAPNEHSTKFSQQPPQSVHLVDKQMKKMEITMNAVHGKLVPVTNGALHSVMDM